jgi:hypothetical protein
MVKIADRNAVTAAMARGVNINAGPPIVNPSTNHLPTR